MNTAINENSRTKLFVIVIIGYLLFLVAAKAGTGDDTYWHIKVGEWIVANKAVPTTGIFSYTAADFPWVSHEWLSALMMYAVFSLAGWPGLVFLATLSIGLSMVLLLRFLLKRTSVNTSMIYLLLAFLLLISHIMPRPHIYALPMTVFWTIQLIKASEIHKAPPLFLALFMTLWVNMHGSFIIGLAFIVFFAAESVFLTDGFDTRFKLAKQWLLFFTASVIASALTPHGFEGLLLPFKLTGQTYMIDHISEWASPTFHGFQPLELWLMLLLALSLSKGLTLPLFRMIFLLGLLHLSLKSIRFSTDLLSFLAPMALAEPFAKQLTTPPNFSFESLYPKKLKHWLILLVYLGLMMVSLVFRTTIESPQSQNLHKVLTALQNEKTKLGNVLNSYAFSVYLIHEGYPVYIDSRAELYGDKFLQDYFDTINLSKGPEALRDKIVKYQITWTVFETKLAINALLELMPGWRKLYTDRYVTIFLTTDRDISIGAKRELEKIKKSLPKEDPEDEEQERVW